MITVNFWTTLLITSYVLIHCCMKKKKGGSPEKKDSKLVLGQKKSKVNAADDDGSDEVKFNIKIKKEDKKNVDDFDDDEENPIAKIELRKRNAAAAAANTPQDPAATQASNYQAVGATASDTNNEVSMLMINENRVGASCYQFDKKARQTKGAKPIDPKARGKAPILATKTPEIRTPPAGVVGGTPGRATPIGGGGQSPVGKNPSGLLGGDAVNTNNTLDCTLTIGTSAKNTKTQVETIKPKPPIIPLAPMTPKLGKKTSSIAPINIPSHQQIPPKKTTNTMNTVDVTITKDPTISIAPTQKQMVTAQHEHPEGTQPSE